MNRTIELRVLLVFKIPAMNVSRVAEPKKLCVRTGWSLQSRSPTSVTSNTIFVHRGKGSGRDNSELLMLSVRGKTLPAQHIELVS